MEKFLVDDLSKTYIKLIRDRADETHDLLNGIRNGLLIMMSPIIPYMTEHIYRNFSKESVHLSPWPKADAKKIDKKLEEQFENAFKIIEKGLAERDKLQIGLKWPLKKADITINFNVRMDIQEIIKSQLNVKELFFIKIKKSEVSVTLDTKLTPELEAEGYARELSRQIQAERKKAGLVKKDRIELQIKMERDLLANLSKYKQSDFIKRRVNAKKFSWGVLTDATDTKNYQHKSEFRIKNKDFRIFFSKKR